MSERGPGELPEDVTSALIELIETRTGIALVEGQIERNVLPLLRAQADGAGEPDLSRYLELLRGQPPSGADWGRLVDGLTNGQTSFFRDTEQFESFALCLSRLGRSGPVHLWSAACSTGEEAYSLAMLTMEMGLEARIVATDINRRFLASARRGVYHEWATRFVSDERRARFFERDGETYRVADAVRERVSFEHHNLVLDPPPLSGRAEGRWDLVVCRNVFLYFTRPRVAEVCQKLVMALAREGRLVVAASESLTGLGLPVEPEMLGARVLHRRVSAEEKRAAEERRAAAGLAATAPLPGFAEPSPSPDPGPMPPVPEPERVPVPAPATGSAGTPAAEASTVADRAEQVALSGDLEGARGLLREAVDAGSAGIRECLALGHVELKLHAFERALEAYEWAAGQDPLLPEVYLFEGLVLRKLRRFREAADALRRALFLAPAFWQAAYLLSGTYTRLGLGRDAARERARTSLLLQEASHTLAFLSPPAMAAWHTLDEDELRRHFGIGPAGAPGASGESG